MHGTNPRAARRYALAFLLAISVLFCSCGDIGDNGENEETTASAHVHEAEDEAQYNETHHWYTCSCGAKVFRGKHTYGNEKILKEATCTEGGLAERVCTECGFTADVELPALGHTYNDYVCSSCGSVLAPSDGIKYSLVNGEYVVVSVGSCKSELVVIPREVNGMLVTGIADGAFKNCDTVREIVLPNTVVTIGDDAFRASTLETVALPSSLRRIGDAAFANCESLASVTARSFTYFEYVGRDAFRGSAFFEDDSNYENGVLYVGNLLICAKYDAKGAITVKNGTVFIADYAFSDFRLGCPQITSVIIPDSVRYVGKGAFARCSSLVSVKLPAGLSEICERTFYKCEKLSDISVPVAVSSVGTSAFEGCASLSSIVLPKNVGSVGERAFALCTSLSSMTVADGGSFYRSEGNCIIKVDDLSLAAGCRTSVIPNGTSAIGAYAFYGICDIGSITVPQSVSYVGKYAFARCEGLENVDFELTDGWRTGDERISSEDVASSAAELLTDKYASRDWTR